MILLSVLLLLSVAINVLLFLVVKRFSARLLQFDSIFDFLQEDLGESLEFFKDILSKPVLMNSPEIKAMHTHVALIVNRLEDYTKTFQESKDS